MKTLNVNGEQKKIGAATLTELVRDFDLEKELVVAEVDGDIVDREKWDEFQLEEGMNIVIVQFVGGG